MLRRLPTFLAFTFVATLGLFALSSVLLAQSPSPDSKASDPKVKPDDVRRTQEENKKLYKEFIKKLGDLEDRWRKSDNQDDKERAKSLRTALQLAEERGVENLFKDLSEGLGKNPKANDFTTLLGKDKKLVAALQEVLRTLETDDEAARIHAQIEELKALIKEVERIKREQENLRARTDNPRSDAEKIAKEQNNLAKQTQEVANKVGGKDPKADPNASANPNAPETKSEPKPEAKPGAGPPEAKPDTQEHKSDNKAGDAASPMDPKGGDPKAGSEPKPSPKGMEAGASKEAPKDGPMAGDPKAGGEPKPMGMDPKGDQKPMAGESKAQGDGKGDPKPSEGQPGGEGKPMTGKDSPPSGGPPSASKPSGSPPSGSPPSGSPPSGSPPSGAPKDNAQENIQQAVPQQKGAEDDLKKNDRPEASKKEDKALEALEAALKELEKRLKQLREKELAKLLGNLEERVTRMLEMQKEVYEATKSIDLTIKKNKNQKTTLDIQKSQGEADKERLIIVDADSALKLMEGEGSAVVFAGVLKEVKDDMTAVQKRLNDARVDGRNKENLAEGTQLIEEGIIEQLTMMKEALKKKKQELENAQNNPPPPPSDGKPPNQKLIDLVNELKLIKSLQEQVNKRTTSYSKQDPGEQAKDPLVQAEIKQLSDRQRVLQEMLHKIATEANQ